MHIGAQSTKPLFQNYSDVTNNFDHTPHATLTDVRVGKRYLWIKNWWHNSWSTTKQFIKFQLHAQQ